MKARLFGLIATIVAIVGIPLQAVDLNARGQAALGVGDGTVSIDGARIAAGGGTDWLDAAAGDEIVFQLAGRNAIAVYNQRTGQVREVAPSGANVLAAGGGCWASWLAGVGLYSSIDFRKPEAALADVGPDCAIGYVPNQQSGIGVTVRERDGAEWTLSGGVVYDLQLLGQRRAIWREGLSVRVTGLPTPVTLPQAWRPRAALCEGEWWLSYWTEQPRGLVIHPFTSTRGALLTSTDAFAHDFICQGGAAIVAWSRHEGEQPGDLVRVTLTLATMPRVELATVTTPTNPPTDPPVDPPLQLQAPNEKATVIAVIAAHPEIDTTDEESLDKGRAVITDWVAQRLNKRDGVVRWGRKSRGRPNGNTAVNPNTDALAYLRLDGKFELYDIIVGGSREASWDAFGPFNQGENGYWVPPQLGPESGGGGGGTNPPAGDVEALKRRIGELEAQVTAWQQTAAQVAEEREAARRRVAELETELDHLKAEIDRLKNTPATAYDCRGFLKTPFGNIKASCEVFPRK